MAFIGMDHETTGISFCIMSNKGDIIDIFKIGREENKQGLISAQRKRLDDRCRSVSFCADSRGGGIRALYLS